MDGLVELDPTGSGGFQLHDFMSPSPRKSFLCKREGFFPHEMTNHCHGAKLARVSWGGLFCYMHPSKYFHSFTVYITNACIFSFCPMSWLAKLELRRFHRSLPSFPKGKVRAPNKKKTLQNVGILMMECDKCDTTGGILSISKSGRGKDLRYKP